MTVIDGKWIMFGVSEDDPCCIKSPAELTSYVERVGFLPLFAGKIEGFSLEERTVAGNWWTGDIAADPWEWREIIAEEGKIAYGKFFDRKAGFISREFLPLFINMRRDGYDWDAAWDDGKLKYKEKCIMDLYGPAESARKGHKGILSFEIKDKAGFGKDGHKNFDGTLTDLQMRMYLCVRGFGQRINRDGDPYGWAVARYAMPEQIWGYKAVTSCYNEEPKESAARQISHMRQHWPDADEKTIRKVLGVKK